MRISDWSSDVCSSDLQCDRRGLVVDAECEQAHGWRAAGAEGRNRRSCVQALAISSLDLRPTFYGPVAPDARYAAFSPADPAVCHLPGARSGAGEAAAGQRSTAPPRERTSAVAGKRWAIR